MQANKQQVKKIVEKFMERLKETHFNYDLIYLYGSYAKGNYRKDSDIDICVISKKINEKNWFKKEVKLNKLKRDVDLRIQPIVMALDEFNSWSPLAYEVKKYGILVDSKN